MRKGIKRCPCPSVRACVRASFCASVRPSFKWVLCERNSSYNFIPILLKLYRCFCQGLKMCMTFGYNPHYNFCHFFHSLNLVIFWAQLLLKLMDIKYLVSATLPTIFSSPEPKAQRWAYSIPVEPASVRACVGPSVCTLSNMNISETNGSIATKFYLKHHWSGGLAA